MGKRLLPGSGETDCSISRPIGRSRQTVDCSTLQWYFDRRTSFDQYVNASTIIYNPDQLALSWVPPKKSNEQFV